MGSRAWICRDPARREEFLACLRAKPRSTFLELAAKMKVSRFAIKTFVKIFEDAGTVASEIDPAGRRSSNAGVPRVAWIIPRRQARIGKPKIQRPLAYLAAISRLSDYPYAPTGTPAELAGPIQIMAVVGPRMAVDTRHAPAGR